MPTESPDVPWAKNFDTRAPPPSEKDEPTQVAKSLVEFLQSIGMNSARGADILCGDGRNSVYLANTGYEVHAIDPTGRSPEWLEAHGITLHCHEPTDSLFFEDNYFDFMLDSGCYDPTFDSEKKVRYLSEVSRTLKQNGIFALNAKPDPYLLVDFILLKSETGSLLLRKK